MLQNSAFAIALVFGTVLIHAACSVLILGWARAVKRHHLIVRSTISKAAIVSAYVLIMALAAFTESALWAAFYVWVGALPDFSDAIYFSLVTFTTLGYGDVTLNDAWRMLAATQAATGILIFGWSTAVIVAVVQHAMHHELPPDVDA